MSAACGPAGPAAWIRRALCLLLAAACLAVAPPATGQETAESRAFKAAVGFFQLTVYDRAEREFRQFVETYPQSPMLPEAILFEARAALEQTNLAAAITLLSTHVARAGPLADQYLYRLATAHYQSSNYAAAVESFLRITSQYTNSPLLLEASYGEALARFRLHEYRRVILSLQDPRGAFRQANRSRPTDASTLRGQMLLAEALLEVKEYSAAEDAAKQLAEDNLTPEDRWDRQHLVCRILVADQRLPEAVVQTTNLIALASATANRTLLADSVSMQAGILQQLNRLTEAAQVYTNNLAETAPPDRRRLALLNLIEIKLAQDNPAEAAQILQTFLNGQPDDASDFLLLTSGELHLKIHLRGSLGGSALAEIPIPGTGTTARAVATNHLQVALAQFDQLLNNYPNSPLRGKAFLNKGWCLWLDGREAESATAFSSATNSLPFSEDLAVARFKLADVLYQKGDYPNAIQLYRSLTNDFASFPRIKPVLFDQALYQIVRASIQSGDADDASTAIQALLNWSPDSELSERGMWLVAQDRLRLRKTREAREMFADFLHRFPDRPLVPAVELAMARTYQLDNDWPAALGVYDRWLAKYPTNDLCPAAEYFQALATERCGGSNAFNLFTNFVARYPTNRLARQAQLWVAQDYYRHENFREAERQFQLVAESTNWPVDRLTYESRMLAGRAAYAGQLWKDAAGPKGHFTILINDLSCSNDIVCEALIAYGDTKLREDDPDGISALSRYKEARTAFEKVTLKYKNDRLVAQAYGRIGDCCLQLASKEPEQYKNATNAYLKAMDEATDATTRSLAEFGLAHALKLQAAGKPPAESAPLLKSALDHFLNILLGHTLKDWEEPDPVWREKAGMDAARVAEELKQWQVAISIYQRLQTSMPALRLRLQDKINRAREQSQTEKERRGGTAGD